MDFNFFNWRHLCKIAWIVVEIHGRFWIEYLWWNQVGSHTLQIYPTFQSYCNCNISNVIQDTNPRWLLHISNICVEQHIVRTAIIMVTIFHAPFKREAVAWMNILLLTLLPRNGWTYCCYLECGNDKLNGKFLTNQIQGYWLMDNCV